MGNQLEEIEIPVPCPGCGSNTLKSIRWLKGHQKLACRACAQPINLDDHGFRAAILDAERSIARIRKEFPDPA